MYLVPKSQNKKKYYYEKNDLKNCKIAHFYTHVEYRQHRPKM